MRSDFCFGGGGQFLSVFFLVLLLSSRTILAAQIARSPFPIDSLCWSADSSFFAVGGSNAVSIYNAKDGRMCITLPVKQIQTIDFLAGKSSLLAVLTQDGLFATVSGSRHISLYTMVGKAVGSFNAEGKIEGIFFIAGTRLLAVQGADNTVSFYNIDSGRKINAVSPCNPSALTACAFSADGSALLEGYADGSVYRIDLAPFMSVPRVAEVKSEKPPPVSAPPAAPSIEEQAPTPITSPEPSPSPAAEPANEAPASSRETASRAYSRDQLAFHVGALALKNPFDYAASADIEWRIGSLIPPFYVGIGVNVQAGLCRDADDFPYSYTMGGKAFDPPFTGGATLYAPLGMQFTLGEKQLSMFMELRLGGREVLLWRVYKGKLIKSKLHLVAAGGLYAGLAFHGFEILAGVDYDMVQSFMPSASIGYHFRLPSLGREK